MSATCLRVRIVECWMLIINMVLQSGLNVCSALSHWNHIFCLPHEVLCVLKVVCNLAVLQAAGTKFFFHRENCFPLSLFYSCHDTVISTSEKWKHVMNQPKIGVFFHTALFGSISLVNPLQFKNWSFLGCNIVTWQCSYIFKCYSFLWKKSFWYSLLFTVLFHC